VTDVQETRTSRLETCASVMLSYARFLIRYLISYRYSSCCCCSCWGHLFQQAKAPPFLILSRWIVPKLFHKWIRIDWQVWFRIWRHTFKMAAMTSFREKALGFIVSNAIGVKFGRNVPRVGVDW